MGDQLCRRHEKDETARVCRDFIVLNNSTISRSGRLGNIGSIFDGKRGSTCFTSNDMASGFTQIEIAEEDKSAFRDAHGELLEFNRCCFGLKTIP